MRTLRQRLQHLRTGFYTFALTFIILGGPISLVASLAFGKTAATWTLGGFLILALALAIIASVGSRKRGLERDRRARGLSPGVRV